MSIGGSNGDNGTTTRSDSFRPCTSSIVETTTLSGGFIQKFIELYHRFSYSLSTFPKTIKFQHRRKFRFYRQTLISLCTSIKVSGEFSELFQMTL